jgi:hypothetical protein
MKVSDLIRFTKTGVMGIIVEVVDKASDLSGPKALVYHAWEDDKTGTQHNESLWYYLDYLRDCAEPATLDFSTMRGGIL